MDGLGDGSENHETPATAGVLGEAGVRT